jgi:hypothetical protein
MRKYSQTEQLAAAIFVVVIVYTWIRGSTHTVLAGIAFSLMVYGALPAHLALALLVGASVTLLLQRYGGLALEGFEDAPKEKKATKTAEAEEEPKKESSEESEETTEEPAPTTTEKFSSAPMLPDNATRREPLELGKAYKLPNERDDGEYHLDAGTTFLNAYKALKPDQIAAMTKDTQELLATQKSLVGMLNSFAPLIQDMKQISNFTNMLN